MSGLLGSKRPKKRKKGVATTSDTGAPPVVPGPALREDFGERDGRQLTDEEKKRARVEREVASDPALTYRPSLRAFRMYMATEVMKNMDGSPVRDKLGNPIAMQLTLDQVLWQAGVAAACDRGNPKQYEFWLAMMTFMHGRQPTGDPMVPMQPAAAPVGQDAGATAVAAPMSEAETANRLNKMLDTLRRVEEGRRALERDATAIDVKAELSAGDKIKRDGVDEPDGPDDDGEIPEQLPDSIIPDDDEEPDGQ